MRCTSEVLREIKVKRNQYSLGHNRKQTREEKKTLGKESTIDIHRQRGGDEKKDVIKYIEGIKVIRSRSTGGYSFVKVLLCGVTYFIILLLKTALLVKCLMYDDKPCP